MYIKVPEIFTDTETHETKQIFSIRLFAHEHCLVDDDRRTLDGWPMLSRQR